MKTNENLRNFETNKNGSQKILHGIGVPEINFKNFHVLLIGASRYPRERGLRPIPNVEVNIRLLRQVLTDKNFMGVPKENIVISLNERKIDIEKRLKDLTKVATSPEDTLFIYYSGHGIISPTDFDLYLTTNETCFNYLEQSSLSIDLFKKIVSQSNAKRKIIVLDACHSGKLHNVMDSVQSAINSVISKFEGTYILTSSSEDMPSLFPKNNPKKPTYFTAKFVSVIKNGVNNNKPYITLRDIYNEIKKDFAKKGLPEPIQSVYKNVDELIFAKNVKYNKKEISAADFKQIKENYEIFRKSDIEKFDKEYKKIRTRNTILNFVVLPLIISAIMFAGIMFIVKNKNISNFKIKKVQDTVYVLKKRFPQKTQKVKKIPVFVKNCDDSLKYADYIVENHIKSKYAVAQKIYSRGLKLCNKRGKYIDTLYNFYINGAEKHLKMNDPDLMDVVIEYYEKAYQLKPGEKHLLDTIERLKRLKRN